MAKHQDRANRLARRWVALGLTCSLIAAPMNMVTARQAEGATAIRFWCVALVMGVSVLAQLHTLHRLRGPRSAA
jgi:hypothetical protein